MSGETIVTVVGNLTGDPELRFTPSGVANAALTIASTPRTFDRQANEWRDGDTFFMRATCWREMAENAAHSLTKGTRVIAQGRLVQRSFETREGEKRTIVELQIDDIAPSLRYATATVTRTPKTGTNPTAGQQPNSWGNNPTRHDDPWAAQNNPPDDEPPF